jgi:hypothetical protein
MKIFTKVDQFTIKKLIAENKKRVEREIFPTGGVIVPVIFSKQDYNPKLPFTVVDDNVKLQNRETKINFGFKKYDSRHDPEVIPEMMQDFNRFVDNLREQHMTVDPSLFLCVDKILLDLGYAGKIVKAEGVETDSKGNVSVYSINYCENLISTHDDVFHEYMYIQESTL